MSALAERAVSDSGAPLLKDLTQEQVDFALRLMILNGGNSHVTSRQLEGAGIEVQPPTLRKWRTETLRETYAALRQEMAGTVGEEFAGQAMELALRANRAQGKLLDQLEMKAELLSPDALARSIQALAQAKSQDVEKAELLRGKPTERREVRTVNEIVQSLAMVGVQVNLTETDEANRANKASQREPIEQPKSRSRSRLPKAHGPRATTPRDTLSTTHEPRTGDD